ncbi:MAG: DUF3160 domain-containing protein [Terriglobales bacterium]
MAKRRMRVISALIALILAVPALVFSPAYADPFNFQPFPVKVPGQDKVAPMPPKELSTEDIFTRTQIPYAVLQPYDLSSTKVPGLTQKSTKALGLSHFVVVDNSPFNLLSQVYRENRLKGKPGFVTADSIIHPYIAFTNAVCASVIQSRLAPELKALLGSMLTCACEQYKDSEDEGVRTDSEHICAYLIVALRLIDPAIKLTGPGKSMALADAESKNIDSGQTAESPVLGRALDYWMMQPMGWYNNTAALSGFYRCYHWLSITPFALSDASGNDNDMIASDFRRSVLLFQTLRQAKLGNESGLAVWNRLNAGLVLCANANKGERVLLPPQYDSVFGGRNVSLDSLSEPLYRTRMLLNVRRQKPIEVGSASIFNAAEQKTSADNTAFFLLFPEMDDPELGWLRNRAHDYAAEGSDNPDTPIALLDLFAHGSPPAANLLADSNWHLNPNLAKTVPPLVKRCKSVGSSAEGYSLGDSRWQMLQAFSKPYGDGAQSVVRSNLWAYRRLESAFAAWVDARITIGPLGARTAHAEPVAPAASGSTLTAAIRPAATSAAAAHANIPAKAAQPGSANAAPPANVPAKTAPASTNAVPANVPAKAASGGTAAQPAPFQYLDPCPDLYRMIASDAQKFSEQLALAHCLTQEERDKFQQFGKLALRLAGIADRELAYQPISLSDMNLLGTIDLILEKISTPFQGTLYLNTGTTKGGCSLGLGRVGYLHILCSTTKGLMLCRGAVYTYYEIPGARIAAKHWERKLQYGMVRSPDWTNDFEMVQETPPVRAGI